MSMEGLAVPSNFLFFKDIIPFSSCRATLRGRTRFAFICRRSGVRCAAEEDNAGSTSIPFQGLTTDRLGTDGEGWRETIVVSNRCGPALCDAKRYQQSRNIRGHKGEIGFKLFQIYTMINCLCVCALIFTGLHLSLDF